MKKFIILLFVTFAASQAFAKKDKKDEKDLKIDSLTKAIDSLRVNCDSLIRYNKMQYDSVSQKLNIIYIKIKEKVIRSDYDAARIPHLIDSVIALKDAGQKGFSNSSITLMDSLIILKEDNIRMKALLESLMADESGKNRIMYELKQLKDLLDAKALTQAEFDILKAKLLAKWQ